MRDSKGRYKNGKGSKSNKLISQINVVKEREELTIRGSLSDTESEEDEVIKEDGKQIVLGKRKRNKTENEDQDENEDDEAYEANLYETRRNKKQKKGSPSKDLSKK